MSNYSLLAEDIRKTTTLAGVERIEKSITRIYSCGFLTANELARLFVLSMDHAIKISEERVKVALSAIEIEGDA